MAVSGLAMAVDGDKSPRPDRGVALFSTNCMICHGPRGEGIEGLGVSLINSGFVQSQSSADLAEFLKRGRLPNDSASVSGLPMPGFAWMTTEDLAAVAAHLKGLAD